MKPSPPRLTIAALIAAIVASAGLPAVTGAQAAPVGTRPTLRVRAVDGSAVRVDGRLDEVDWSTADSIANLTQIEPVEGAEPSGRTAVRVLATADAVIFGIRADDPEPHRITSFSRNRDANLTNEDHIRLVLDTYQDGRSGYVFIVNPHGARFDALVANQGKVRTRSGTASGKPPLRAPPPAGAPRSRCRPAASCSGAG